MHHVQELAAHTAIWNTNSSPESVSATEAWRSAGHEQNTAAGHQLERQHWSGLDSKLS